jgi:hypothetical protein
MFHTVYLSYETGKTGRDYVGKHSGKNPYDTYLGSFKDTSFNPTDKIILEYSKTEEGAILAEIRWQRVLNVVEDPQFVNRSYQTSTGFTSTHPETRLKISKAMSGENNHFFGKTRPDHSERMSGENNPFYGRTHSEENKKAWSEKYSGENARFYGRTHTEETLQKMSEWQKGKPKGPCSPERRKAASEGMLGMLWWVNKNENLVRSKVSPGEGWQNGRKWREQ